ncbi:MAG: hypothetical protein J6A89_00135 [Clostridia bacterium]|nr:hypothetical protein [Clostridia bacterium]
MNNFFPPINMHKYNRPNLYIPPPAYKVNYDSTYSKKSENYDNTTYDNSTNKNEKKKQNSSKEKHNHLSEKPLFEIYGIKLYSDDILILLIIFFLYKEEVNDMLLLVALFSLLF